MITKNRIIAVLSVVILILIYLHYDKDEVVKETTIIKREFIQLPTVNLPNLKPKQVKLATIKVPQYIYDTKTNTVIDTVFAEVETKKYSYDKKFKYGTAYADVYSDSVYKFDLRLDLLKEKETVETTKTIVKSNLFFGASTSINNSKSIDNITLDAYYVRKDKWLLNGGIGYSIDNNKPFAKVGVALKW